MFSSKAKGLNHRATALWWGLIATPCEVGGLLILWKCTLVKLKLFYQGTLALRFIIKTLWIYYKPYWLNWTWKYSKLKLIKLITCFINQLSCWVSFPILFFFFSWLITDVIFYLTVKFSLLSPWRYKGCWGIAPFILNLGIRTRAVINVVP